MVEKNNSVPNDIDEDVYVKNVILYCCYHEVPTSSPAENPTNTNTNSSLEAYDDPGVEAADEEEDDDDDFFILDLDSMVYDRTE